MRQTPLLKRKGAEPTLMAGKAAGREASRTTTGAIAGAREALGAFQRVPQNPHTADAVVALKSALRDLEIAQACADAMAKGVR